MPTTQYTSSSQYRLPNVYSWMAPQPDYQPGYTNDMSPMSMVDARLSGINLNTKGLEQYRREALRQTPSKWANLSEQKQFVEEMDARERAKREAASARAGAEANLAMRGGLSSGARERVQAEGMKNMLGMSQDVGRQGTINRMGIGIQDESNRIQQLGALPGMEVQALQPLLQKESMWQQAKDRDTQRIIDENNRRQQYNLSQQQEYNRAVANQQQANATRQSGGGSSYLCRELMFQGLMSKKESVILTKVCIYGTINYSHGAAWYLKEAPRIVELLYNHKTNWKDLHKEFVTDVIECYRKVGIDAATRMYIERIGELFQDVTSGSSGYKRSFLTPSKGGLIKILFTPSALKWTWHNIIMRKINKFKNLLPSLGSA